MGARGAVSLFTGIALSAIMIVTGCLVYNRRDPELQGEVTWLSPWRRLCRVKITSKPRGNALTIGQEYPFPTSIWGEAGMQGESAKETK